MKILTVCSLAVIVLIFTYSSVHAANVNTVGTLNILLTAQSNILGPAAPWQARASA